MKKIALAASAAFLFAIGTMAVPASAADLDFFEPAPPPPLIPTWQGFYIGGHFGYGDAKFNVRSDIDVWVDDIGATTQTNVFSRTLRTSLNPDGILGGVQGGYNFQSGALVFGIEGDISFTDMRRSRVLWHTDDAAFDDIANFLGPNDFGFHSVRTSIDSLASVRGRIGFAPGNLLLYGTGGVAWADANVRSRVVGVHATEGIDIDETRSRSLNNFGFVVGGGASWMVIPQTFSLGVEGLYYFFDRERTITHSSDWRAFNRTGTAENRVTARLDDVWVLRVRGDFHF